MISFQKFKQYALKLLQNGTKVCPCCLSKHIVFTTNDEHSEFYLECAACHIGAHTSNFTQARRTWEHRPDHTPALQQITHNITCEYFDDGQNKNRYITTETLQKQNVINRDKPNNFKNNITSEP